MMSPFDPKQAFAPELRRTALRPCQDWHEAAKRHSVVVHQGGNGVVSPVERKLGLAALLRCEIFTLTPERSMPNLSTILKSEITRLARKEIKAAVDPVRKANAGQRKEMAELKRLVASLQRDLKAASKPAKVRAEASDGLAGNSRFTAKGLKSLRAKLGLSAAEFGQLVGASGQSIYKWEQGKAAPRASQQASLAAVRGIGKREAAKRLAAIT